MTINKFTRRAAATFASFALAASALAVGSVPASAAGVATRTASAAVDNTYLSKSLGLPTDTVIETVTYDRFQWLLKQPGQFAFLIGSASDANFAANAVKVDTAAKAAGAAKVYWFDPNLTGQTGVKSLDIRNTANINLHANSQTIFGNVWKNVLGQHLGNGIKSVPAASKTTVTITADDTVVNDAVDPIWDYSSTAATTPSSTNDFFFVYDKDHVVNAAADKITSWVNLSTNGAVETAVPAAFTAAGGGSVIDQLGQFDWWKDSANAKHDLAYADDLKYGGDILANTDDDNGWVIKQITYPELLNLLEIQDRTDRNFVILFGGTWCHNTRAVLKQINQNAIENGVTTVYNFDLVLDGGTTNGTNGGANPIHVRSAANGGTPAAFNFRPSWVYGDVVRKYFKNLVTEYDPNSGSHVSYYPGGDLTAFPDVVRRLQVPFLINYQHTTVPVAPATSVTPASNSIKRQWIQRNVDPSTGLATYKEYMTEQWFTVPSAQLGLSFALPTNATEEAALSDANKALLASALANKAFGQQALEDLNTFFDGLPGYVPTRTLTAPTALSAEKVVLTLSDLQGRVPTGNATLKLGGKTYVAAVSNGVATFNTPVQTPGAKPYTLSYATDSQIAGFSETGTLNVAKFAVSSVVGTTTKAPTASAAGTLKVVITRTESLPKVGGKVLVTLTNGATVKSINANVSNGAATVALPKLTTGSWVVAVTYLGDANFAGATPAVPAPITVARVR
ncbi:MAG: hypothetical protein RLY83_908 [Actinomycetota bacterium]|jgi:hypothetical protein